MIKKFKLFKYFIRGKVNIGFCPICDKATMFVEKGTWLRDEYICNRCESIPRQRAIISVLKKYFPNWKNSIVHESSPGGVSSDYIQRECAHYSASQFFADIEKGAYKDGVRSENLECLTFDDESMDIIVSQDVFEHVMDPQKAFAEIARVLKPGGAHIFTLPLYHELEKTRSRAIMQEGKIVNLEKEIYHGNPIDMEGGSLVTVDWGMDVCDLIREYSGLETTIYLQKNRSLGLDAEFLEVFVSRKGL